MNKRRKIPIFRVITSRGDFHRIEELPEIRKFIIEESVFAVKDAVKKKLKTCKLFELRDYNVYVELDKENWKEVLQKALDYYTEKEEYNKCIECRDLINSL